MKALLEQREVHASLRIRPWDIQGPKVALYVHAFSLMGSAFMRSYRETVGAGPALYAAFIQIIHSSRNAEVAWKTILWGEGQG